MQEHGIVEIPSPEGVLRLRPEHDADADFRYRLFCDSRPPEWYLVQFEEQLREQLNRHQFTAQTRGYLAQFPRARFDIIELGGERIGRIVVDRPGHELLIVDQAIVPQMRGKGLGTAIMRSLMDEAAAAGIPVRLTVGSSNDPSLRLYQRLGFEETGAVPMYVEMQWTARPGQERSS